MPRPKTTLTFSRGTRPPSPAAETPEADRTAAGIQLRKHASADVAEALTAKPTGEPIAKNRDANRDALVAIANTVNIKALLDPGRFRKLSRDVSGEHFSFSVETANGLALKVTLGVKTAQKAHGAIEQHGLANISLMLTGRLGPNSTLLNPGLAVNVKPQKT